MKFFRRNKNILRPLFLIIDFVRLESSSGILLFIAALLALILANSSWHPYYDAWVNSALPQYLDNLQYHISLLSVTNDFLMTVFFLLVGLEIKREIVLGELNSLAKISLPAMAALGGMVVPALIYYLFNHHDSAALKGWAIPTATDIGFALGVMALLGNRVPLTVKLFLMALAIFDDIGAIVIIAVFYQSKLAFLPLTAGLICLAILWILNKLQVNELVVYCLLGLVMWLFFLESGIHATVAGVLLAFTIPLRGAKNPTPEGSPLYVLMNQLHPYVAYIILPVFSFANAGISFKGLSMQELFTPVSIGIMLGLWIGKQLGIFGATWVAIRLGWSPMLKDANWRILYGTALICGIGFTMSLFIGNLAFDSLNSTYPIVMRVGVFAGSFISGVTGYCLLRWGGNIQS